MRPINKRTRDLSVLLMKKALASGDMNAAGESFGYCFYMVTRLIAKDEKLDHLNMMLAIIARVYETVDQPNLRPIQEDLCQAAEDGPVQE